MTGARLRRLLVVLSACTLVSLALPAGDAAGADPASPGPFNRHALNATDFVSASDGWAVGGWYGTDSGARSRTIARHWDGTRWRTVPTMDPGGQANTLYGVAAIASDDAWAVGLYEAGLEEPFQPLIEHWDGVAWTHFPAPEPQGYLHDVVALAPDDVWAVGSGAVGTPFASLIEHWDGTSWSRVTHPQPGNNGLMGITAVSPRDIWAVGYGYQPLVEHWNGHRWKVVLHEGPGGSTLTSVSAVASDDIWAVGRISPSADQSEVLVYHWDGTFWSQTDAPAGDGDRNLLYGVTALASNDVWAVGSKGSTQTDSSKTLVLHWDGTRWKAVKSPNRARADINGQTNELDDVAAVSADDIWSVGQFQHAHRRIQGVKTKEMIVHWDGAKWTNVLVNKEPVGG